MTFTAESNKKLAARLIEKHGVDEKGKSIHHKRAGAASSGGYFKKLKETPEGRAKLKEISQRGAAAKRAAKSSGDKE